MSAEQSAGARERLTRDRWIAAVCVTVLAADQATKAWAVAALDDRVIELVWTLRLRLVHNTGIAFSAGRGLGPVLALAVIVIVGVLWSWRRRLGGTWGAFGLGGIIGGALGNLADRIFRGAGWGRGAVVDFIDLQWWPIFNVADASITVGLIIVLVHLFLSERRGDSIARGTSE
ncbi:signal peptidase II [Candidatus Poriferisodalis sp.]|uniref:signal peptidase II n=1 Tax=Candidatus Poriferisodalis sp. TaxID=3101277 RepID=UPI003B020B95